MAQNIAEKLGVEVEFVEAVMDCLQVQRQDVTISW